jgi:hypothetical protein
MEDLAQNSQNAADNTNASVNAVDASGLTKNSMPIGFNANVGKQSSELKTALKPTSTDPIQTSDTSQYSSERLKSTDKLKTNASMPEGNRETTGFSDILSKKSQSYMAEKMLGSTSQVPSTDNSSSIESKNTISPNIVDSPKNPERPEAKIAKQNPQKTELPKQSAPAFKPTPSIQIPKFTLPNFKR